MSVNIVTASPPESTDATERRFLALAWLDPVRANDTGYLAGLRPADFSYPPNGQIFGYIVRCAEEGRTPAIAEALDVLAITPGDLDAALFIDGVRDAEFADYAGDIRQAADKRTADELRSSMRDTIRAIQRGLNADAELFRRDGWAIDQPGYTPPKARRRNGATAKRGWRRVRQPA